MAFPSQDSARNRSASEECETSTETSGQSDPGLDPDLYDETHDNVEFDDVEDVSDKTSTFTSEQILKMGEV